MKRISTKKAIQLEQERILKKRMVEKGHGIGNRAICALCNRYGYVEKHEILPRSLGGDPLDESNCVILCRPCHIAEKDPAKRHHLRSDFPFAGPV